MLQRSQGELDELKALAKEAFALMESAGADKSASELLGMDAHAWAAASPQLAVCALKMQAWRSRNRQGGALARKLMACIAKELGDKAQASCAGFGRMLALAKQGDLQALASSAEAALLDDCALGGKKAGRGSGL